MMQKVFRRVTNSQASSMLVCSQRGFALLTNYETQQPPKKGSLPDNMLDTKAANSKYYNPYTFDPQQMDYQQDVRLAVRDELPSELDSSDVAESMY